METRADTVFVTGGTGYLGRPLVQELSRRWHAVLTEIRKESA